MRKALLAIALILSLAYPAITNLSVWEALDSSGTANMKITADFQSSEGQTACLSFSASAADVTVRDRSGLVLAREIIRDGNSTRVCASVPADYLEYELSSASFTAKSGPLWEYDLSLGASMNISFLNASLYLPEGATLKGTNGAVSRGGDSLVISYSARDIDAAHRARMRASYELAQPASEPDYALLAFGAILLLIASFAFLVLRKPGSGTASPAIPGPPAAPIASAPSSLESNAVFKTLDETDKGLIREIQRQGGKTTQAQLNLHTHVPKATLSRRLATLENRGILQKSQKGNRNLVSLTDLLK